jgi:CBS domain-containing protein
MEYAAQLMWDGDCGAVPVFSSDGPVGIITDRDICMASYTRGRPLSELQVGSAMSKNLFSCASDDSVADALKVMGDKRVRRLAVLGPARNLVGMLALADIARWARPMANPLLDAALVDALASISSLAPHETAAAAQ